MRGLEEAGVEAIPLCVEPSPLVRAAARNSVAAMYVRPGRDLRAAIRRARAAARVSPAYAAVSTWSAPRALRDAGPLDGIVQIGTGYELQTSSPVATFEDMTILQTRTHPYEGWGLLSTRAFASCVARQRRIYEQSTACCLTSRWAAESVVHQYGIAPSKVHVVGVGQNHAVAPVEREWDSPRFLFVGLDWERKNGAGVLRAFGRLREEVPAARLDLVGGHPAVDEPGVTGHGALHLDVPEHCRRLEALFAQATCFVMPSHSEASAIVYVEAAAAGLPSIGTIAGGSDYLIGAGGLVVDPASDDELLHAMRRLCDPRTAATMGAAARERARMFTWRNVARRLLTALDGAPGEPGGEVAAL
jgi:glycosyltransferase involved in cell wall biosynthesis